MKIGLFELLAPLHNLNIEPTKHTIAKIGEITYLITLAPTGTYVVPDYEDPAQAEVFQVTHTDRTPDKTFKTLVLNALLLPEEFFPDFTLTKIK